MPNLKYMAKAEKKQTFQHFVCRLQNDHYLGDHLRDKLKAHGRCGMEKKGKPCQDTAIKEMSETPTLFSSRSFPLFLLC